MSQTIKKIIQIFIEELTEPQKTNETTIFVLKKNILAKNAKNIESLKEANLARNLL